MALAGGMTAGLLELASGVVAAPGALPLAGPIAEPLDPEELVLALSVVDGVVAGVDGEEG